MNPHIAPSKVDAGIHSTTDILNFLPKPQSDHTMVIVATLLAAAAALAAFKLTRGRNGRVVA